MSPDRVATEAGGARSHGDRVMNCPPAERHTAGGCFVGNESNAHQAGAFVAAFRAETCPATSFARLFVVLPLPHFLLDATAFDKLPKATDSFLHRFSFPQGQLYHTISFCSLTGFDEFPSAVGLNHQANKHESDAKSYRVGLCVLQGGIQKYTGQGECCLGGSGNLWLSPRVRRGVGDARIFPNSPPMKLAANFIGGGIAPGASGFSRA